MDTIIVVKETNAQLSIEYQINIARTIVGNTGKM